MQFHMGLQHRHGGTHHLGDVVDVSGDSLSILVRVYPSTAGAFVLSACYMYTRVYECARYQPVLHVRITRNDRLGRFPLTLGAPAFLQRDRLLLNGHLITRSTPKSEKGSPFTTFTQG